MHLVYKFCGGRKVFTFYLILAINAVALFMGKFNNDFATFCCLATAIYSGSNVVQKFSK